MITAEEAVNAARFAVAAATSELERARARLRPASLEAGGRVLPVLAPVDGVVLRRLRESESVVPAGEPLVEIGDPGHLEIVADLLSTDAVRVKPRHARARSSSGAATAARRRGARASSRPASPRSRRSASKSSAST